MSGLFLWKKASKYSQEYIVSSCLKQDEVPGNGFFSYLRFRKSPWTPAFRLFDFPPLPSLSSMWRMDFLLCVLIWISCHVCLSVDSCYICWFVNLFTGLDFWLCLLVSGFLQCLSVIEFCCIDWSVDLCYVYWSGFPVVFACGFLRCV